MQCESLSFPIVPMLWGCIPPRAWEETARAKWHAALVLLPPSHRRRCWQPSRSLASHLSHNNQVVVPGYMSIGQSVSHVPPSCGVRCP